MLTAVTTATGFESVLAITASSMPSSAFLSAHFSFWIRNGL